MSRPYPHPLPPVYTPLLIEHTDSAFAEALRRAASGAPEGTLVQALTQRDGRGRSGAPWRSRPGDLHAALILRPEFPRAVSGQLAAVAAVSLGAALAELVAPMTHLGYGWPNDVLLGSGKVAGIRMAAASGDPAPWLVVGLSVNLVADPEDAWRASLAVEGESAADAAELLAGFARHFLDTINQWADDGFEPVRRAWLRHMRGLGDAAVLRMADGSSVDGRAREVTAEGDLLIDTADGPRHLSLTGFFIG